MYIIYICIYSVDTHMCACALYICWAPEQLMKKGSCMLPSGKQATVADNCQSLLFRALPTDKPSHCGKCIVFIGN